MTVKELIDALSKCDQSMEVYTEGCDCWGDVESIELQKTDIHGKERECILLQRSNNY